MCVFLWYFFFGASFFLLIWMKNWRKIVKSRQFLYWFKSRVQVHLLYIQKPLDILYRSEKTSQRRNSKNQQVGSWGLTNRYWLFQFLLLILLKFTRAWIHKQTLMSIVNARSLTGGEIMSSIFFYLSRHCLFLEILVITVLHCVAISLGKT